MAIFTLLYFKNIKNKTFQIRDKFPIVTRYGFAVIVILVVLFLKVQFAYLYSGPPLLLFFLAILAAAWFGGVGPGTFSAILGGLIINWHFTSPPGEWHLDAKNILVFLTLIGEGSLMSYVLHAHKRSTESLDIAEKKFIYKELYDELTGLPNKRYFNQEAEGLLQKHKEAALFIIDLDHFRDINETVGRDNGDLVLKKITSRLKNLLEDNAIIGRLGGDDFLVFIPYYSEEKTGEIANKILSEIQRPINLDNHRFRISASIGIAMYPQYAENIPILLKNAEIAMRYSKQKRNSYSFYDPEQGLEYARRIYLAQEIKEGIEQNEFEMYYQPIFDIKNKKLIRAEALIRWNHPTQGLLYPGEFIPIAEETGSILPLNEWVFEKVCMQIKDWEARHSPPVKISINLSGKQFSEKNMVKKIERTILKTGVNPHLLEVEISESIALDHSDRNAAILNQIKKLGIQVALDDFGTGYASLSYLTKFPIDTVKIDQSFIASAQKNLTSKTIIKSIVTLAYQLNLNYVVEGIENKDQLKFMANLNCTWMQGFFLGKPLPHNEFYSLINDPDLRYTLQDLLPVSAYKLS